MEVCFNGEFFPADAPLLAVQNAGYKWGDGVFETMKVHKGQLLLQSLHFERLLTSLRLLGVDTGDAFLPDHLTGEILTLCSRNHCLQSARIRLAVYRTGQNGPGYSIEAIPLSESVNEWQEKGLQVLLYPFARKSMDAFSNLKTASFLPYVLAQRYAEERGVDDAIVLNAGNFLCDSSRANVFLVKDGSLYTPALHQGCINGVMRRVVLETAKKMGFSTYQEEIVESRLLEADEVFLTNAIQIIRWVKGYKTAVYKTAHSRKIFNAVSTILFPV